MTQLSGDARFKAINQAYQVLSDKTAKQEYDLTLQVPKVQSYGYQEVPQEKKPV